MLVVFWRPQEWLVPQLYGFPLLDGVIAVALLSLILEFDSGKIRMPRAASQLYLLLALFVAAIASNAVHTYFGGIMDGGIKGVSQILIPIPVFLIQVVIAGSLDKRDVTIYTMAFIVVLLAWMGPTLVIRSQVLTMKERSYVSVAKLSGVGDLGIIFGEILPNLLPFIAWSREFRREHIERLFTTGGSADLSWIVHATAYGLGIFSITFIFLFGLALRNRLRL